MGLYEIVCVKLLKIIKHYKESFIQLKQIIFLKGAGLTWMTSNI